MHYIAIECFAILVYTSLFRGIQNYSILIGSLPYNKSFIVRFVIFLVIRTINDNWDSLFLNFKFLFRNNSSQLTTNCTQNHPITTTIDLPEIDAYKWNVNSRYRVYYRVQ